MVNEENKPGRRRRRSEGPATPAVGAIPSMDGPPAEVGAIPSMDGPPAESGPPEQEGPYDWLTSEDGQEPVTESRDVSDHLTPEGEPEAPVTASQSDGAGSQEPSDPTAPIGRKPARRGGVKEEPQAAFGDLVLDVENGARFFFEQLEARSNNREAASIFNKADAQVKQFLVEKGFYDGKPHNVRAGDFLIVIAPSDNAPTQVSFTRNPPIRKTISRPGLTTAPS